MGAVLWHLLTGALGLACVVAGVFLLLGIGWALVTTGGALILVSAYIRRGLNG